MPELVRNLASRADRPIIDDTQLAGLYAFVVELPPLNSVLRLIGQMTDRNGKPMDSSPSSASIFKAVERLGLRLEERRAPLDFLVIEQARSAPTAN